MHPAVQATIQAARYHGIELDPGEYRNQAGDKAPSAASLVLWAQAAGLWARAAQLRWRDLFRLQDAGPLVLLLKDGGAALLVGSNKQDKTVQILDPTESAGSAPIAVDELRLSQNWTGQTVLLRAQRSVATLDARFNLRWLIGIVLQERRSLRDIGIASLTISILTIFPPLLVMATVNKVLQFQSISTLILLSTLMAIIFAYETLLGYARRLVITIVGTRLDTKLGLHLFNRLLQLPLDYFERHPAGETMYRVSQIYRIREFITGKLLSTFLDLTTLCILLPVLFYLQPVLASIVLLCALMIAGIIFGFMAPLKVLYSRVVAAETWKAAALNETIFGIRTIKSLGLEPTRKAIWDERLAEAGKWRIAFGKLSNWPQTLVNPIERFMVLGTMMIGAYLVIKDPTSYMVGGLFAFMMLSSARGTAARWTG